MAADKKKEEEMLADKAELARLLAAAKEREEELAAEAARAAE